MRQCRGFHQITIVRKFNRYKRDSNILAIKGLFDFSNIKMVPKHLCFRNWIWISYLYDLSKIIVHQFFILMKTWSIKRNHTVIRHENTTSNRFWLYSVNKKILQSAVQYVKYLYSKGNAILIVQKKKFSNFSCMFLNPNNFFQFEF